MSDSEKRDGAVARKLSDRKAQNRLKDVHPVCRFAPDKQACQRYLDRLEEAADNIERRART